VTKNTREHLDVKCTLLSSDQKDNPWGFFSIFLISFLDLYLNYKKHNHNIQIIKWHHLDAVLFSQNNNEKYKLIKKLMLYMHLAQKLQI
jgi:hypothetical protein